MSEHGPFELDHSLSLTVHSRQVSVRQDADSRYRFLLAFGRLRRFEVCP